MLRAVIYCRCSTEEESQQNALIQQVQESRKSVQEQGWLLVDEYIEAKSGTTIKGRSEYNRLFQDLLEDKFDIIQIKTQDRLMRNTRDWYLFIDRLVTNGKRLYMYLENRFYTPDDALITGIKAILAEEYSRELSKKINNAHFHRQRDGRSFILPPSTYGLKKTKDGGTVLVEEEAEVIREIFALGKRMGCASISHYLNERGITNRAGKPFTDHMVRHIIKNPIRCGMVVQNKKHFDFQCKKTIKMPEDQWIVHKDAVPAAVSEEEWKETNACMEKRAGRRNVQDLYCAGRDQGKYQLSGKIRCGLCGHTYYRTYRRRYKDKQMVVEWKCSQYLQEGRRDPDMRRDMLRTVDRKAEAGCDNIHLDEKRLNQLLEKACLKYYSDFQVDYPHILDRVIAILKDVLEQNNAGSKVRQLRAELERQERQRKKLLDKLLAEVISDEDYRLKKGEIEGKIKALTEKRNELQTAENAQLIIEQRLKAIRKRLEKDTIREAAIAEKVDNIDSITVYPTKLVLSFRADKLLGLDAGVIGQLENASVHEQGDFEVTVPLGEDFLYAGRKLARKKRVLSYMKENPRITAKEIARKEGMSLSGVNSCIARMEKKGILHFEGAGGRGFWVIDQELDDTLVLFCQKI